MPIAKRVTPTNPILVTRKEAAEMLGVSLDFFKDNVQPELRIVKRVPALSGFPSRNSTSGLDATRRGNKPQHHRRRTT